jgi:hypothetical protein
MTDRARPLQGHGEMDPSGSISATLIVACAAFVGCQRGAPEPGLIAPASDAGTSRGASGVERPTSAPNALIIPSASVDAVVNPGKLPLYQGPTGSLEGTVFLQGPEAPLVPQLDTHTCPAAIDTYGKLFRTGPPNADHLRPLADALVAVTGYVGYFIPDRSAAEQVTIGANCGYSTRAIAMTFGQRLEIANESTIPFAPTLQGAFQPAVMIVPPGGHGAPVKIYPPKTGYFALGDTMQPFVHEDVFVLRQPFHAVTDLNGHYRIDGVPIGTLKVSALLAPIGASVDRDITIRANVVETADLVLTYTPSDAGAARVTSRPNFIP